MIHAIIEDCLFALPSPASLMSSGNPPPKCKSDTSRRAAFSLLSSLAKDSSDVQVCLLIGYIATMTMSISFTKSMTMTITNASTFMDNSPFLHLAFASFPLPSPPLLSPFSLQLAVLSRLLPLHKMEDSGKKKGKAKIKAGRVTSGASGTVLHGGVEVVRAAWNQDAPKSATGFVGLKVRGRKKGEGRCVYSM